MRRMFLALIVLILAAPIAATAADFPNGFWYTEGAENGSTEQILIQNNADHTFTKKAAFVTDCSAIQHSIESGTWTFDGTRYTDLTLQVDGAARDPKDPGNSDAFDVKRLDADHVTMFDPKTGVTWTLARMADFTLPPSAHCAT